MAAYRNLSGFMARMTAVACLVIGTLVRLSGQGTNDGVGAIQVTKPSDRTIVVTRTFAAPRQKVFDTLTKPDQVPRWFQPKQMPLLTYEADLRAGGAFRYVFRRPSGARIEMRGVYKEIDPPHRWVHTETDDFSPLALLVTTVLDEVRGKTVLTQTMLYSSKEERDGDFDAVASSSAEIYAKLDDYLKSSQ
jgi:uncharacterized protein YndB with AHSA1/START domain